MKFFLISIFSIFLTVNIFSQGCSDAGLCSVPTIDRTDSIKSTGMIFSLAPTYSLGEHFTSIISPIAEIKYFYKNFFVSAKIPYLFVFGDLSSNVGLGDISLGLGTFMQIIKFDLGFNLGLKLPTGKTDAERNEKSLPMVYQTGLGTTDVFTGISLKNKNWQIAIAAQLPINNSNSNAYLSDLYGKGTAFFDFYNSRNLIRSGDLMLRVEKSFFKTKSNFSSGLIVLYHLKNDKYTDINNNQIEYPNSEGFTVNLNFGFHQKISSKFLINYTLGFPIYARENRPDGLTRTLVFIPEFIYNF